MWLPASVSDDLLCVAPGIQPATLRTAAALQRGTGALRHPPRVCQREGHSHNPGCFQGMCHEARLLQTALVSNPVSFPDFVNAVVSNFLFKIIPMPFFLIKSIK